MQIQSTQPVRSATVRAVITRADGTVEDLGVVCAYYKNPFQRILFALRRLLRRRLHPQTVTKG